MPNPIDPKWFKIFKEEMAKAGIIIDDVIPDGEIHRCGTVGKETGKDASYVYFACGEWPGAWGRNFRTGETVKWFSGKGQKLNFMQRRIVGHAWRAIQKKREEEIRLRQEEAAKDAQEQMELLGKDVDENPYMLAKGVRGAGELRSLADKLFVPVYEMSGDDEGYVIISAQTVTAKGKKLFLAGGKTKGGFFPIGDAMDAEVIVIAEGIATGLSIHEATGYAVFCAFGAYNIPNVAGAVKKRFVGKDIIVAGDDGEAGRKYALEAAANSDVKVVFPTFKEEGAGNDFNDLHLIDGLVQVKRQVQSARFICLPMGSGILHAVGVNTYVDVKIEEREMMLYPCIPMKGIVMLYAPRGLGKTYVGLTMALALATAGTALKWFAEKRWKVMYIDGEMPAYTMQERLKQLMGAFDVPDNDHLKLLSLDYCGVPTPNLTTPEGQSAIDRLLGDTEVLFLDNLSTLCGGGDENSADSWDSMQAWLLSLRQRGVTVVFVHHANKDGGQRGTSKREDILDTTIALQKPEDYDESQGARFTVCYEKNRGFFGDDAKKFNAQLVVNGDEAIWDLDWVDERKQKNDERKQIVGELLDQGMTVEQMAEELGVSSSTAGRIRKKVVAERGANGDM